MTECGHHRQRMHPLSRNASPEEREDWLLLGLGDKWLPCATPGCVNGVSADQSRLYVARLEPLTAGYYMEHALPEAGTVVDHYERKLLLLDVPQLDGGPSLRFQCYVWRELPQKQPKAGAAEGSTAIAPRPR